MIIFKSRLIFLISLLVFSCAHKKSSQIMAEKQSKANPRPAAYGSDGFYNDRDYENEKKIPPDNFFFKKCRVYDLGPVPVNNEWECTEAMK